MHIIVFLLNDTIVTGMTLEQIRTKLSKYKIGIAGAGGLGSNCAASLVRSGIINLVIADFDVVTDLNLNRQFYFQNQVGKLKVEALKENLLNINPDVTVEIIEKKLIADDIVTVFGNCDVIVEAFDNSREKQMLIETVLILLAGKPLVIGNGMAGWGNNDSLFTQVIDNIYICGDQETEVADEKPPLGPRVGIVANMQANQVLEILLGKM